MIFKSRLKMTSPPRAVIQFQFLKRASPYCEVSAWVVPEPARETGALPNPFYPRNSARLHLSD
ncbi:MAG: hypothetical protein DME71_13895 [Verrucomicrobia bacterium]|nr:MAG: hypothetical protein DME71_13895 [Verrucomicrobiota bacterium]